jgi:hypothetical protein
MEYDSMHYNLFENDSVLQSHWRKFENFQQTYAKIERGLFVYNSWSNKMKNKDTTLSEQFQYPIQC